MEAADDLAPILHQFFFFFQMSSWPVAAVNMNLDRLIYNQFRMLFFATEKISQLSCNLKSN